MSGKYPATVQSRQSETFCKELAKSHEQSYDTGYNKRLQNPFILPPRQSKLSKWCQLTKEASDLVNQVVQDMLKKGAIVVSDPKEDQLLSSLFLVKKKDGENQPTVNLKDLNCSILYQHFKMEGLFLLKEMLLPGDKMCEIDLKDAYFVMPLSVKSRSLSDSSGKAFYMSFVAFASGFLQLLWFLQSY